MVEAEMRNALNTAMNRIAALEESNATLRRDLNQMHANRIAQAAQTAQLMTTVAEEIRKYRLDAVASTIPRPRT